MIHKETGISTNPIIDLLLYYICDKFICRSFVYKFVLRISVCKDPVIIDHQSSLCVVSSISFSSTFISLGELRKKR